MPFSKHQPTISTDYLNLPQIYKPVNHNLKAPILLESTKHQASSLAQHTCATRGV